MHNDRGETIQPNKIADAVETTGYGVLGRKDRMNSMQVNAAAVGRPVGTIMQEIQMKLAKVKLPEGTFIALEGMSKNQAMLLEVCSSRLESAVY